LANLRSIDLSDPNFDNRVDVDNIATAFAGTSIAPSKYNSPYNFPTDPPAAPVSQYRSSPFTPGHAPSNNPFAGFARIAPLRPIQQTVQQLNRRAVAPREVINYHALWHPRDAWGGPDSNFDRLFTHWQKQMALGLLERDLTLRNNLDYVYVNARQRGILHQLNEEKEVLWEPEGRDRLRKLERTTAAIDYLPSTEEDESMTDYRDTTDDDADADDMDF